MRRKTDQNVLISAAAKGSIWTRLSFLVMGTGCVRYKQYSNKNQHSAFAYVWNKTDDWCSELGTITVKSAGGGIKRIA